MFELIGEIFIYLLTVFVLFLAKNNYKDAKENGFKVSRFAIQFAFSLFLVGMFAVKLTNEVGYTASYLFEAAYVAYAVAYLLGVSHHDAYLAGKQSQQTPIDPETPVNLDKEE